MLSSATRECSPHCHCEHGLLNTIKTVGRCKTVDRCKPRCCRNDTKPGEVEPLSLCKAEARPQPKEWQRARQIILPILHSISQIGANTGLLHSARRFMRALRALCILFARTLHAVVQPLILPKMLPVCDTSRACWYYRRVSEQLLGQSASLPCFPSHFMPALPTLCASGVRDASA